MKEGEEHFLESDQAPRKEEGREGDGRTLEVNAIRGGACARVRTPYGTGSDPVSNANLCNPTRCTVAVGRAAAVAEGRSGVSGSVL